MKKLLMLTLSILVLLVFTGCGGSGEESSTDSPYSGSWYDLENDTYLSILNNGSASIYECSLSGYTEVFGVSGVVVGTELILNFEEEDSVFSIEIQGDDLSLTNANVDQLLSKASQIPSSCDADVIEISSVLPSQVVEGEIVEFTVQFDYRLSSAENAIIDVGFTNNDSGDYTIVQDKSLDAVSTENASNTIIVTGTASIFENGTPFYVHINLSPVDYEGLYSPYFSDEFLIDVIPLN